MMPVNLNEIEEKEAEEAEEWTKSEIFIKHYTFLFTTCCVNVKEFFFRVNF